MANAGGPAVPCACFCDERDIQDPSHHEVVGALMDALFAYDVWGSGI